MNLGPKSVSAEPADDQKFKSPHANWRLYAAAGAAALAASSAADASIIYVNPSVKPTISTNTGKPIARFSIDGSGGNLQAFHFATRGTGTTSTYGRTYKFSIKYKKLRGGIAGHLFTDGGDKAKLFKAGAPIVGGPFAGGATFAGTQSGQLIGEFAAGQSAFAGFELPASKGGVLGWLRVDISSSAGGAPDQITLIDYAYATAAGESITAGEGASVPEPSALGLLAMGSAGVLAWRKRRTTAVGNKTSA